MTPILQEPCPKCGFPYTGDVDADLAATHATHIVGEYWEVRRRIEYQIKRWRKDAEWYFQIKNPIAGTCVSHAQILQDILDGKDGADSSPQ